MLLKTVNAAFEHPASSLMSMSSSATHSVEKWLQFPTLGTFRLENAVVPTVGRPAKIKL